MKLYHITDPHFNFKSQEEVKLFGRQVKESCLQEGVKVVVLTGDLSESPSLSRDVSHFMGSFKDEGIQVLFVLGNHDFYGGSIRSTLRQVEVCPGYLPALDFVPISEDVALCGVDGWYDLRAGTGQRTRVHMSDWVRISDMCELTWISLVDGCRSLAKDSARKAIKKLELATVSGYKKLVLATHVPPFEDAAWYNDSKSDPDFLPIMTNITLGEHLLEFTRAHPEVQVDVLCGHTHYERSIQVAGNLNVHVGKAEYGELYTVLREFP